MATTVSGSRVSGSRTSDNRWPVAQREEYTEHPHEEGEERHDDTKGEEIPKWVVLEVMHSMKEDKAVGYDGIPITMWKTATAARQLAVLMTERRRCSFVLNLR